jgi:2,4-dienoyl-CoA reductase-like NADH-dependent reductase (Old Yellow Enzyme family)
MVQRFCTVTRGIKILVNRMQLIKLFEIGRIRQMEVRNRIVMSPMLSHYGNNEGFVTERIKNHYESSVRGCVGMAIGLNQ